MIELYAFKVLHIIIKGIQCSDNAKKLYYSLRGFDVTHSYHPVRCLVLIINYSSHSRLGQARRFWPGCGFGIVVRGRYASHVLVLNAHLRHLIHELNTSRYNAKRSTMGRLRPLSENYSCLPGPTATRGDLPCSLIKAEQAMEALLLVC